MDSFKIIEYNEGLKIIAKLAIKKQIIPIIGAGFTMGCNACGGIVPDGNGAKKHMIDRIISSNNLDVDPQELNNMDFTEIADLFFSYVNGDDRADYFEQYYTDVLLPENQINFLSIPRWKYAYTLNVDDAIEGNADFTPILPYHKFRKPKTSKNLLYKLHGDALFECQYETEAGQNIIYSQNQYMQALTNPDNTYIYQALLSDYCQNHMLFIGCSLQNEQDIQFVYAKSKELSTKDTYRIVIRDYKPNIIEQNKLIKHGINTVVVVPNYELFYGDFLKVFEEEYTHEKNDLYEYMNPDIIRESNKETCLKLLANGQIFNSNNSFRKSDLHVSRTLIQKIINSLNENSIVLLKGRRFSGKTYLLCSIIEKFKKSDIYFFPSFSFTDESIVDNLIVNSNNCLFVFDSNSITPDLYGLILNKFELLTRNNNKMIIAVNSSDNYLPSRTNCTVEEIYSTFDDEELRQNRKAADRFALARRKFRQTNIDYLVVLKEEQNVSIPFLSDEISFSQYERCILIALTALDKMYFSDLIALRINGQIIDGLIKKVAPIIEKVNTTPSEASHHSTEKLVHNSKYALLEILKRFSDNEIADSIYYIVSNFKPDYSRRRLYIDIILFDTLNQIFSKSNKDELIKKIYIKLQPLLESDSHYWLQRAKSIYRTSSDLTNLMEAYGFAKKSYMDNENDNLKNKSALSLSLICCALAEITNGDEQYKYYEEAVLKANEAIFSDFFRFNPRYLISELQIGKNTGSEKRILNACKYIIDNSKVPFYIRKSEEIIDYFSKSRGKED